MEGFGLKEGVIFTYSTKELSRTEKVKFHYSLKGRNSSLGFLESVNGRHIGSTVLLVPKEFEDHAEKFLAAWQIPFEKISIVIKDEKKDEKENKTEDKGE